MARSAGGSAAWLTPWRKFFSNHPKNLALRLRLLLFLDCVIFALIIAAITGPWYRQEWRVANGEILSWTLNLTRAKFAVDCSSDSPEFLDLCQMLYGRMAGDLRAVTRSICSAARKVQDTDLQALLQETCSDMELIQKLSVSTGGVAGMSAFFMAFGLVAFLLHAGGGFRNRRAWRASFGCHVLAWIAITASCVIYSLAIINIEDMFHFQPPLNVSFDPAQAEPVAHELLYGFIIAIVLSGLMLFYLPFWWKAAPFDPDPYFLEPSDLRQGFV
ncbi:hypothetical protein, conserved [Eimeria acervulina]|uniref:Transmembrane protein n=1 Tax=Eimeria acervulina TaxID=5801 RepID=U6GPK3_EIMAC|nr:hypothetical protein, conserved [Eimeria acervulina]CDI80524.1 hypothetical protein, conserved [Eimeria acervulina]